MRKPLERSFVYIWIHHSGGQSIIGSFFGKCRIIAVKIKECKIKWGGSTTFQKRH